MGVPAIGQEHRSFTAGTRLVQVEVVVRNKNGPVTGLTRDDFEILDQGKAQPISVFAAGSTAAAPGFAPAVAAEPGAVSNRAKGSAGATVLLLDQLNTAIENQGYAQKELVKYLQSADAGEQIAIYLLGSTLKVVQDFTGDRATLAQAVRKWNPVDLYLLLQSTDTMDEVDRGNYNNPIAAARRAAITVDALGTIAQHLSGMPGRKSLIWVSDSPAGVGMQLLSGANIHLYPVLARGVGSSGVFAWMRDTRAMGRAAGFAPPPFPAGHELERQRGIAAAAAATGGAGFTDSQDLSAAVRTAALDRDNAYVLGFYPAEEALDNKFHTLAVKLRKESAHGAVTIRYRPGYFASKAPGRMFQPASVDSVLRNPLDATAIGITAAPSADGGRYSVTVTVDLRDVSFTYENNRHLGGLEVSFADDATRQVQTETLRFNFTDTQYASVLQNGLTLRKVLEQKAAVRIVARDPATGAAGSVRVSGAGTAP